MSLNDQFGSWRQFVKPLTAGLLSSNNPQVIFLGNITNDSDRKSAAGFFCKRDKYGYS